MQFPPLLFTASFTASIPDARGVHAEVSGEVLYTMQTDFGLTAVGIIQETDQSQRGGLCEDEETLDSLITHLRILLIPIQ